LIRKYLKKITPSQSVLILAFRNFLNIGGSQRAAAFAYYSFFSIFPLIALTVSIASFFVDEHHAAGEAIGFIKNYVPMNDKTHQIILTTLSDMVEARDKVIIIAPFFYGAAAFRFFNVLVRAVNRAWGTWEKRWWTMLSKNLLLLGIVFMTISLGVGLPVLGRIAKHSLFAPIDTIPWIYYVVVYIGPMIILFGGLVFFYKHAPCRETRFAEVWFASLVVTGVLYAFETLFVIYLKNFSNYNVVYGVFGGMMALLTLIYFSGSTLILGACLSAAQQGVKIEGRLNSL